MRHTNTIRAADTDFVFSIETQNGVQPNLDLQVTPADMEDTYLICMTVEAEGTFKLTDLSVEWTVPIVDMNGLYWGGNPTAELTYLPYWHAEKHVCANTGIP